MAGSTNNFSQPSGDLTDKSGPLSLSWAQWYQRIQNVAVAAYSSGPTAQRPVTGLWLGRQYYDTTLNKPVFVSAVNPTVWRDAAGAVV